jgi:hypothetical protein
MLYSLFSFFLSVWMTAFRLGERPQQGRQFCTKICHAFKRINLDTLRCALCWLLKCSGRKVGNKNKIKIFVWQPLLGSKQRQICDTGTRSYDNATHFGTPSHTCSVKINISPDALAQFGFATTLQVGIWFSGRIRDKSLKAAAD